YTFVNWTENGSVVSTLASYTFTLTANRTLVANFTGSKAVLTTPTPGSTFGGAAATFAWTSGTGVSQYWLDVGSTPGGTQLYSQSAGTNLSAIVNGLPTDGRAIYVRLWSLIGAGWYFNDYSYTAASQPIGVLTAPSPGSALSTSSITFSWTAGSGVSGYWLYIGTTPGGAELLNASTGSSLSATVNGLPADGRNLYVRLWSLVSGNWRFNDYTFTAGPMAGLTTPTPQSTLSGATATFGWNSGSSPTQYWLFVGTKAGGADLYNQSAGTNLSATVNGLPTNGRTVYVRLWARIGNSWTSSAS